MNRTNPFALTDTEKAFTSDDWAWQFLRISPRYKVAYEHAKTKGVSRKVLGEITEHFAVPQEDILATDNLAACARDFGLAAWLDPDKCKTLPELKNGGSWFFPLKRVIQENPLRLDVASEPPRHFQKGPSTIKARYQYLEVGESPFGYTSEIKKMFATQFDPLLPQQVFWVAVDCSVPPDGQMQALRILAEQHKAFWRSYHARNPNAVDTPIRLIASSEQFIRMAFQRAHDRKIVKQDTSGLWRAVGINPLRPLAKQISDCQKQLTDIHRALRDGKKGAPGKEDDEGKLNLKFPSIFPYSIRGSGSPSDKKAGRASYVKALLSLSRHTDFWQCYRECEQERQLQRDRGERDAEGDSPRLSTIAENIGLRGPGIPSTGGWQNEFESRMPFHVRRAHKTITWAYRWLVHDQTFGHPKKLGKNDMTESI